jgi:cytochrome o ubiquinol oxidase operon protein cyoD
MSKQHDVVVAEHDIGHGTLKTYVGGYLASIVLTVTAYLVVTHRLFSTMNGLIAAVIALALVQFLVQLILFLRLGRESKPRWKLLVFGFMVVVVAILVFGSLWIMSNLNYRMTPAQINNYMKQQSGGGF